MRRLISFYADAARIAFQSIFAHKLRAFLTLLGIIIGVASVVVVGASINGLNTYVLSNITKILGANTFYVTRVGAVGRLTDEEWEQMVKRNKKVHWEELQWVREQCTNCEVVGAERHNSADLKQEGEELFGTHVMGVTPEIAQIRDMKLAEGRFFIPYEVEHALPLGVIGMDIKEKFFPLVDPIGRTLKLNGLPLTVVGVKLKWARCLAVLSTTISTFLCPPLTIFTAKMQESGFEAARPPRRLSLLSLTRCAF
jgi:putative ABC transport system permease protein